jgi:hypothetical protein
MDRSFLSQPAVIAASRRFVCVRLTTYESKEEAEFLKSFHVTRSGEVENTVFTILSSDGKRQLARASRSARQTFGDAASMSDTMNQIAVECGAKDLADGPLPALPTVANVRLAVDVAACDNLPMALLFAPEGEVGPSLEERVRRLAWSKSFLGRFVYVRATAAKDLAGIEGARSEPGLLVVQPDAFGLKGSMLRQIGAASSEDALAACLREGAALHHPPDKSFREHVLAGHDLGVFWETAIPVTDPMELQARERGRARAPRRD